MYKVILYTGIDVGKFSVIWSKHVKIFFFRGSATIYKNEIDELKDLYMLQHFSL